MSKQQEAGDEMCKTLQEFLNWYHSSDDFGIDHLPDWLDKIAASAREGQTAWTKARERS